MMKEKIKISEKINKLYEKGSSIIEISRKTGVNYSLVYSLTKLKQRGFNSRGEYQKYRAEQNGFGSLGEYRKYLAEQNGFDSVGEYQKYRAKERQKKKANKKLSDLIVGTLKKIHKSQYWLAKEIGVSRATVSQYARGEYIPKVNILQRIFSAIKVPYKSLEDLLNKNGNLQYQIL